MQEQDREAFHAGLIHDVSPRTIAPSLGRRVVGIEKIDRDTQFTRCIPCESKIQMPSAHAAIVLSSLLEETERSRSSVVAKERKMAVHTETDIENEMGSSERRFDDQMILLGCGILMQASGGRSIVPRSSEGNPMLDDTRAGPEASRVVEVLLLKDEELWTETVGESGEDIAQDPLFWVRADRLGKSAARLKIIRTSQFSSDKHKLRTHEDSEKATYSNDSTAKKSETRAKKFRRCHSRHSRSQSNQHARAT
ncbi:uncharacterized protein RCC_11488 [Ramularia collo-cygni]|uniref:Uncharacterized protein n=1 Tax=Ramularia collo-cygni TaxID=112498 RepID=A0A2D3VQW2_9PEZI|nr:uncharacterized protein RCC_11488 [Ramularia collo-cygni]CZT25819.1 uncharacterized protein RCC_11488 [Ramularia collo-cygni]